MALELDLLSDGGMTLPKIENGAYPAVIVSICDIGKQLKTDAQTKEPVLDRAGNPVYSARAVIGFELPTEKVELEAVPAEGTNPAKEAKTIHRRIYKEYALVRGDNANLAKLLKTLAPEAKSVADLLGKPCTVQVDKTSTGKDKIASVSGLTKGMSIPVAGSEKYSFDFDKPDAEVFAILPEWLKSNMAEANNYTGSAVEAMALAAKSSGDAAADAEAASML